MYALVRKIKKKNVSKTFLVTWVLSKSHIDSKKKKKGNSKYRKKHNSQSKI